MTRGDYSFTPGPGSYFICESAQNGGSAPGRSRRRSSGDTDYTAECDDQNGTFDLDLATGGYCIAVTSQSTDINTTSATTSRAPSPA